MMRVLLTIAHLLLVTAGYAQEYHCPVVRKVGVNTKSDNWISVRDNTVVFKAQSEGKIDSAFFMRQPSTNPSIVFMTDGDITASLSFMEGAGIVMESKYNFIVSLIGNVENQSSSPAVYYCERIKK